MRRFAFAPIALVAAVMLSSGVMVGPIEAAPGDRSAVREIGNCLNQRSRLFVEFLIDQSGSLEETDPDNNRVSAIKLALSALEGVADASRGKREVEVRLSGFDVDYDPLTDWVRLDAGSVGVLADAADAYATRNRGFDTDYAAGFLGAQASLRSRVLRDGKQIGSQPCQAIMWFTDGKYDIDPRRSSAAVAAYGLTKEYAPQIRLDDEAGTESAKAFGKSLLCAADGLMDQLRADEVPVLAFTLASAIEPEDQAFLAAMVAGTPGAQSCGEREPLGAIYPAGTATEILFGFNEAIQAADDGTPVAGRPGTPLCPGAPCEEGTRTVVIDPGVKRFNLLAVTGGAPFEVQVIPPGSASPISITETGRHRAEVRGVSVADRWLATNAVVIEANRGRSDEGWVGTWKVVFLGSPSVSAGAEVRSELHLFGDVQPRLQPIPRLVLGSRAEIRARVVNIDGTPATDLDDFRSVRVGADVFEPGRGSDARHLDLRRTGDVFVGEYSVELGTRAANLNISLQLDLVTESGIALAPVVATTAVPVLPPESYPELGRTSLAFGPITGEGDDNTSVLITGGTNPGCVWFSALRATSLPEGIGGATVVSEPLAENPQTCIRIGAREKRRISLRAATDGAANGVIRGQLAANLRSDGNRRIVVQDLPVRIDVQLPINQLRRLEILLGLLIPGILLPFLLIWLLKWMTAKFEGTDYMRLAVVACRRESGVLRRSDTGVESPLVSIADLRDTDAPASRRKLSIGELRFETRVGGWPQRAPYGLIVDEERTVLHHDYQPGHRTVPLSVGNSWFFIVEIGTVSPSGAGAPSVEGIVGGSLVVVVSGNEDGRKALAEIEAEFRGDIPRMFESVERDLEARTEDEEGPIPSPDEIGAPPSGRGRNVADDSERPPSRRRAAQSGSETQPDDLLPPGRSSLPPRSDDSAEDGPPPSRFGSL